jgi:hypothetical protein
MSEYPVCADPFCDECRRKTAWLLRHPHRPRKPACVTDTVETYSKPYRVPWPWVGGEPHFEERERRSRGMTDRSLLGVRRRRRRRLVTR